MSDAIQAKALALSGRAVAQAVLAVEEVYFVALRPLPVLQKGKVMPSYIPVDGAVMVPCGGRLAVFLGPA